MFTPGVAVLLGFVLLAGNPWLNRDIQLAVYDFDSAGRLVAVLFSYPAWQVDAELYGPFMFWFANLRTLLFVTLAVAGLTRVPRWTSAGGLGLFVVTVGMTALSAVVAGLASAGVAVALLDTGDSLPFIDASRPEEFFLGQLSASASFGVLFGSVLGAVAVMQSRTPVRRQPRADTPKSFW
ncbi:hypothetical protein ABZX92_29580 [Lentzea sp. NPDC006480]|uniref:hypothetical protein n=1 Tax=Lentzea sp. NPDC006480 TaxID=3157176 RepID=UPI0033A3BF59